MDQYYVDYKKMREPFIGESLIFDYLDFSKGDLSEWAYCFVKKGRYFLKENKKSDINNLLYVKDNSILVRKTFFKREFYRVKIGKDAFSNSSFDKIISLQPIKKGKLEENISLFSVENKEFRFVGFFK